MPSWHVRTYEPGDEHQLVELFARVFGRRRATEAWRWKLLGRPADHPVVWVAEAPRGELIGQYAAIPLTVRLGGVVRSCVNVVEAMTHPAYRRQGVLTTLASAAHATWAEAGNAAVFGLPNDQWRGRRKALGYEHVSTIEWLRFPLRLDRVVDRHHRLPAAARVPARWAAAAVSRVWRVSVMTRDGRIDVSPISERASELDAAWSRLGPLYRNAVVRDAAWVTWRFRDPPGLRYRVLVATGPDGPRGHISYRMAGRPGHRTAYVADLFTGPRDVTAARTLLATAMEDASRRGAATVVTTAVPSTPLHRHLRAAGFLGTGGGFGFDVVFLDPSLELEPMRKRWQLTAGDFDIDLDAGTSAGDAEPDP